MDLAGGSSVTAEQRAEHLKDIQQLGNDDAMQRVLAAYWLWMYAKKENENGFTRTGHQAD
jgi:hypothetical protein